MVFTLTTTNPSGLSMPQTVLVPSTAGVRIHVQDWGGSGPPLLFLSANGFHGRCYAPMVCQWLACRLRTVRMHCIDDCHSLYIQTLYVFCPSCSKAIVAGPAQAVSLWLAL